MLTDLAMNISMYVWNPSEKAIQFGLPLVWVLSSVSYLMYSIHFSRTCTKYFKAPVICRCQTVFHVSNLKSLITFGSAHCNLSTFWNQITSFNAYLTYGNELWLNGMPFIFQYLFRFHRRGIFSFKIASNIFIMRGISSTIWLTSFTIHHLDSVSFVIIIFVSIHKIFHFIL